MGQPLRGKAGSRDRQHVELHKGLRPRRNGYLHEGKARARTEVRVKIEFTFTETERKIAEVEMALLVEMGVLARKAPISSLFVT